MKLRGSAYKKAPPKKRLNFSAILTKDYFSKNIIKIQLALNKKRMVPLNYNIRRVKSKLDTGMSLKLKKQKEDEMIPSYKDQVDINNIPQELEKILEENEKKFMVQNKEYFKLKEENDKSLGYWHYIQKIQNNKKDTFNKKYFGEEDKNMVNLNSDKVQKLSEAMFKLNPLLITKEKVDLFFYYLGEFNKYFFHKKKYEKIKKKVVLFLNNLKDFLDYVAIKSDTSIDSIGKQIKLKNSKFLKELNNKIEVELQNMEIKQKKLNDLEIKRAKRIIRKTKKTLKSIKKNKNFFEDPVYFDPRYSDKERKNKEMKSRNKLIKNNNFNLSAPNFMKDINTYKMNKTAKMSTASTGFFHNENKNEKNIKIIPKIESSKNRDNIIIDDSNSNLKKNLNLTNKRLTSLNYQNNKIILNAKAIKSRISRNDKIKKEENKKSSDLISASSSFYNNQLEINNLRRNLYNKNFYLERKSININSLQPPIEEDKDIILTPENVENINEDKSERNKMIKINKNILKKKTFNYTDKNYMFKFKNPNNSDLDLKFREKRGKTFGKSSNSSTNKFRNYKNFDFNDKAKTKTNLQLSTLYESIRVKPKLNDNELKDINTYFIQNGKKIKANFKLMDIISQAKKTLLNYDIEQKTKKVAQSNLTSEQTNKLKDLKEINNNIEFLDVHYISSFIDFKSKTLCDNNLIKG